ncbi:MAG: hypothetical protein KDI48_14205, partial [Xanthomonadales bacterium]|nr:hypothetical protein [Xanthomonadales bacterium]
DLGWYTDDGRGAFDWHSLLDQLPESERELDSNIRVVHDPGRGGIWYLFAGQLLFYAIDTDELRVVRRGKSMVGGFLIDGELWIHHDQALTLRSRSEDDRFVPLQGREPFGPHGLRAASGPCRERIAGTLAARPLAAADPPQRSVT